MGLFAFLLLQETKALRIWMQMDVETVQASPALVAHLQTSPVRTCRASPVLLHVDAATFASSITFCFLWSGWWDVFAFPLIYTAAVSYTYTGIWDIVRRFISSCFLGDSTIRLDV